MVRSQFLMGNFLSGRMNISGASVLIRKRPLAESDFPLKHASVKLDWIFAEDYFRRTGEPTI
jgi:hypothetical protein